MQRKVEKSKTANDHYWCTRLGVVWFLCGLKMTKYKSGGLKRMESQVGCNDWLGKCLTYVPLWENVNNCLHGIKSWNDLYFLDISCAPSLVNIAKISSHSLWMNQLIFSVFRISTLVWDRQHIPIEAIATYLMILGAHKNILFIVNMKTLVLIKWSYTFLELCWLLNLERPKYFEYAIHSLCRTYFLYPFLEPHRSHTTWI